MGFYSNLLNNNNVACGAEASDSSESSESESEDKRVYTL